jgi:FAD/FMN-containing dehydrogenase
MGRFYLGYYFTWTAPHDEPANRQYALDVFRDLKPLSKGSYINEMNQEDRPQDVPSCYSTGAWARLEQLRSTWDPRGVFHHFYGQA